jgi:ribosomal protein S27E
VLHEAFRRVRQEVERFLMCGDVRYGFVEVKCADCAESRVVAFSCKGRGWCPSCTTRRALETGIHLETVLPRVAHRQWTLSVPFSVRFAVVKKPKLLKRLEVRLVKAVWRWQRREARRHGARGTLTGGGVCFWQWFGSSLQLTPHLHLLVAEAQWEEGGTVVAVAPPGDEDVERILARVLREAKKDWAELDAAWPEDEYEALQQQAIQERRGLVEASASRHRARRLAVLHGFSLHADTAVHGNDRQGLERLCRYGARGPVAECRLRRLDDGLYEYSPKKGAAFTVTAAALVRRLVALLPPARRHLTSLHGAYAPNAHLRAVITQPLPQPTTSSSRKTGAAPKPKRPRLDWAQLHQRTFGIDVLLCPCGGRRSIRRLHSTRSQAEARLLELGVALPSSVLPPATAPPQLLLAM